MSDPIRKAREQSQHGPRFSTGLCLQKVRGLFGIPAAAPDAIGAWHAAEDKHPAHADDELPRGVPLFWSGGSQGHGHIAVSTGYDGMCWSPDTKRPGYFDKVRISDVTRWVTRGEFLGYTLDLNGHPINPLEKRS